MEPGRNATKKRIRKEPAVIENAVQEVVSRNQSIRSTANAYGIAKSLLARLVKKAKESDRPFSYEPNIGNRKIFSKNEETLLAEYLKTASKMSHGLGRREVCRLAYSYAKKLTKNIPEVWNNDNEAGIDWYKGFIRRNKDLSLRKPEKTSLARSTAFNKITVAKFFEKLKNVYEKYNFTPDSIYNADETSLLTVTELPKVVAQKGVRQVGQVVSSERGQLVTMLAIVSAIGNSIPPVFVFPRVNFKPFMIEDCPIGSLGLANKSGWMTGENFFLAFKHFVTHAKPSKEKPVLLLVDNHESHLTLDMILHAKENNVVILTLPPHCSHRLQPLDVSVFGPFKGFYKVALNNWIINHPGRTASIYNIPKFSKEAYEKALTIKNISAGFRKTGIFPFNAQVFSEEDFLCSYVSDRPFSTPTESASGKSPENILNDENEQLNKQSCSRDNNEADSAKENSTAPPITPETVRPFPKAPKRDEKRKGRKRGSSRIVTDTPEVEALKEKHNENEEKKRKISRNKSKKTKRKIFQEASSSSEEELEEVQYDDDEGSEEFEENEESDLNLNPREKDFVLVKFTTKENNKYSVGQILHKVDEDEYKVKFLQKSKKTDNFKICESECTYDVNRKDIILKLPEPRKQTGTKRVETFLSFPVDLSGYSGLE